MIERHDGPDTFFEAEEGKELCDFCSELHPTHFYKAADVLLTHDDWGRPCWSKGDWAACDTCALLIDTNNRVGLSVRAFHSLAPHDQTVHAGQIIRLIHNKFFESRIT
jgi:hypothetical protein